MDKTEIIVYELASVVYSLSYAKTPDIEREIIANVSNLLRELQKAISVFDQIYVDEFVEYNYSLLFNVRE